MPIHHRHAPPPRLRRALAVVLLAPALLVLPAAQARGGKTAPAPSATAPAGPTYNYPTSARVEFVGECMARNGGAYVFLHKCSCVIDQIAMKMNYDDFVESSTFSRYATLGGEGGAIFRDPEEGKRAAKHYRDTEAQAHRACGIGNNTQAGR